MIQNFMKITLDVFQTNNEKIMELKSSIENHDDIEFNFDDKFLDYPLYKGEGKYSDLKFNFKDNNGNCVIF